MIKINLLPVRAAKKKETAVQQISIFCICFVLVLAVIMSMYFVKRLQISDTKNDISTANNTINALKLKIGKLEELKTLKEQVKKKLDVLNQLRKNKTGPAQRLATLSDSAPEQLWLTSYSETNSDIKISGLALNEELIASFMRMLEASADYMGVELVVSEQKESDGVKLKRFDITCKLRSFVEPAKIQTPVPATPTPTAPPKK
jgi:type IV pilus assembly protein PilN